MSAEEAAIMDDDAKGLEDEPEDEQLTLVSSDGTEFHIAQIAASLSELITSTRTGDRTAKTIELRQVNTEILAFICEYLAHHNGEAPAELQCPVRSTEMRQIVSDAWDADFINKDKKTIFGIILGANYMDIKSLLHLSCAKIATLIKALDQNEINRMIEEEEERYRRERTKMPRPNSPRGASNPPPLDAFLNENPPLSGSGTQESTSTNEENIVEENDAIVEEKQEVLGRQHEASGTTIDSRAEVHEWLVKNGLVKYEDVLFKYEFMSLNDICRLVDAIEIGAAFLKEMGLKPVDQSRILTAAKKLRDSGLSSDEDQGLNNEETARNDIEKLFFDDPAQGRFFEHADSPFSDFQRVVFLATFKLQNERIETEKLRRKYGEFSRYAAEPVRAELANVFKGLISGIDIRCELLEDSHLPFAQQLRCRISFLVDRSFNVPEAFVFQSAIRTAFQVAQDIKVDPKVMFDDNRFCRGPVAFFDPLPDVLLDIIWKYVNVFDLMGIIENRENGWYPSNHFNEYIATQIYERCTVEEFVDFACSQRHLALITVHDESMIVARGFNFWIPLDRGDTLKIIACLGLANVFGCILWADLAPREGRLYMQIIVIVEGTSRDVDYCMELLENFARKAQASRRRSLLVVADEEEKMQEIKDEQESGKLGGGVGDEVRSSDESDGADAELERDPAEEDGLTDDWVVKLAPLFTKTFRCALGERRRKKFCDLICGEHKRRTKSEEVAILGRHANMAQGEEFFPSLPSLKKFPDSRQSGGIHLISLYSLTSQSRRGSSVL